MAPADQVSSEGTGSMGTVGTAVREATDEEVAFYHEHGWVHLPRLLEPENVARLRGRASTFTGTRAEAPTTFVDEAFGQVRDIAERDDLFRELALAPGMARNATRFLVPAESVRLQVSNLLTKEPASRSDAHGATSFHQDFPWMPMDRSVMLTIWVALVDVPPEMGSLRFYERSHRYGTLGRSFIRAGDDAPSQHPWLRGLEVSAPLDLAAGDATVHDCLTIHGAPENNTDTTRLSFTATYFDAAARYTGAPYKQMDDLGILVNRPFDHPKFPLVPTP